MTRYALETLVGIGLLILLAVFGEEAAAERHETTGVICEWGKQKIDLCRHDTQEEMIDALLLEMNLDEKIGQMTQSVWHNKVSPTIVRDKKIGSIIHTEGPSPGPDVMDWIDKFNEFQKYALTTRLGIPLLIAVDAIHGQNTFDGAVIFPHNIGMAATRNLQLIKRAAEVTAIEVAGTGFNWTFSPVLPCLNMNTGAGFMRGTQKTGISRLPLLLPRCRGTRV